MNRKSLGSERIFDAVVMIIVGIIALMFLIPLLNVLASSFSSADKVVAGEVGLFPVDFEIDGYLIKAGIYTALTERGHRGRVIS